MKVICIILLAAFFCSTASAQTPKADRLFERWEYFRAAELYKKEAAKHPSADLYFKLGECYRKMNLYKEEQEAYDQVNAAGSYGNPLFYLYYGQVLKTNGRNAEAKIAFNKYTALIPSDFRGKFFSESIDIVADDHAWDEPVSVRNVKPLNSTDAELCPVVYRDGIVFTSNRKTPGRNKVYGWTGANYLTLYFAKKGSDNLTYTEAEPFGGNTVLEKYNNGPACFSKNFDTLYITRVAKDLKGKEKKTLEIERNKIYMSVMEHGIWKEAVPFYLNNNTFSVANPYLSPDGTRIYFVSDMPGGYGETDIYYCNREGNGWSAPINMGPNVNTFNREKYPAMDADGNFYFSSDGYQGFGGLDICVARNNHGTFEKAVPLKDPFNSPADDFGITFLNDAKTGYITTNRSNGGQGDDDIYYFDLLNGNEDKDLTTSVYIIGYRPKTPPVIEEVPVIVPPVAEIPQPADIHIYFDFDEAAIRSDAIIHLDSVLRYMNEFKDLELIIGGHCDSRGTSVYNMNLSIRRSNSALHYLIDKGIDSTRMSSDGYGAKQLVNDCDEGTVCSDDQHQLNRSVYFHFVRKE